MFKEAEVKFLNLPLSICLEIPSKFTALFERVTFTLISTVGDNIKEAIAIFINNE